MGEALATIRPYFIERIQTVDPKFQEHEDAFNLENIAKTRMGDVFHILFGNAAGAPINQNCLQVQVPVTITLWEDGHRTPKEAVDIGLSRIESISKECLRHSKRLNQPFIKNVALTGFNVEAYDDTNDNIVKCTLNFTCMVHIDITT